ncbi:glutamine amidotransferase [Serratia proteamaculans]|nr:glutamine amidotransferase [Serratia proteamaculans]
MAGESWYIHMIHSKGFDSFTSSKYEEGAEYLLSCLRGAGMTIDYIPAHTVQTAFPQTLDERLIYDAVVISDIGSNTFLLQNKTFYRIEVMANALSLIKDYVAMGGVLMIEWPILLGYKKFIAKPGSETLAEINGDPLLVVGKYQKGHVACFSSDCSPHWGGPQFMQWENYTAFWCNLMNSIKRRN